MRIVFLGSPEYAVPSLRALENSKHKVVAVVTQPDAPKDRGHRLLPCAVKDYATKHNMNHLEYARISRDGIADLKALNPDLLITVAYGQILSGEVLAIPKFGTINAHGSLLPKYRGASPIQSAIAAGEEKTGVTIMRTELGLDTGPILLVKETKIGEEETAGELAQRLADLSAEAIIETLDKIENGTIKEIPQDDIEATISKKITKGDAVINWHKSANSIKCQILSQNPNPVTRTVLGADTVKIYRARVAQVQNTDEDPGTVIEPSSSKKGVFVQCGEGVLEVVELCMPGGKKMDAKNLMMSKKLNVGNHFVEYAFDAAAGVNE